MTFPHPKLSFNNYSITNSKNNAFRFKSPWTPAPLFHLKKALLFVRHRHKNPTIFVGFFVASEEGFLRNLRLRAATPLNPLPRG